MPEGLDPARGGSPVRRLLVVDDESDMLDFIERVFRREYEVLRATSVDDGLAILESLALSVIITDQRMPRRSGFELLERAAADHPAVVRVLLTGYAESSEQPGVADAYVIKPVDGEMLRQAVTEAVERRRRAAALLKDDTSPT